MTSDVPRQFIFELIDRILVGLATIELVAILVVPLLILLADDDRVRLFSKIELRGFADSYSSTPQWAISAIGISLLSVTVGPRPGLLFDLGVILAFSIPAAYYLYKYSPFGLWVVAESKGVVANDDGTYEVDLLIIAGSNIDEYEIEIDSPTGVSLQSLQAPNPDHQLSNGVIMGESPRGTDEFRLSLYVRETTGVGYDDTLDFSKLGSTDTLAQVNLQQRND